MQGRGIGISSGQAWTTGFFKHPINDPIWLGRLNLDGDGQADLENHGGIDKAVNVYPIEHYSYWLQILSVTELAPGAFGENFTTEGLSEGEVCIGDTFEIGQSLVEVSQPRQPCWKLARRWGVPDLALRVQKSGLTGWYFRVLREGLVQVNQSAVLLGRPFPQWTIARANLLMHHQTDDRDAARDLANCPALSSRWRVKLARRADTGMVESHSGRLYGPHPDRI
ncbi:MAG: MOSC domain-containing protein [Nitrospira sp.]|nr:MOSC domain-containing protein [Nitrospira sp.]